MRIFFIFYEEYFFIYFYPKVHFTYKEDPKGHFIDKEEKYYICVNIFKNEKIVSN